jgi:phosphoribosylamine--glycine ligase/phosphoribosylformylglycinamidine cyclo-ligase
MAGVSIEAGNSLVQRIKPLVKQTRRTGADGEIGGFGGLFDLKAAGFHDPVLVAGIDGIGTKIKVAQAVKKYDTVGMVRCRFLLIVGIDLVAMNVNDVLVQGAEPLFFLDYYACGKLNVDDAVAFVKGVADGCIQAGCALLGGETAEMPSLYAGDDFDGAGAAVGAVDRSKMLPRKDIQAGDVLLGLPSSGCHSNGFSLVRKTLEHAGVSYDDPAPWDPSTTVGKSLLAPTKIYCKAFLAAHKEGLIKAASHITGGGFLENIPRMLPASLTARVHASTWKAPSVFRWLAKAGNIQSEELAKTFNMGIGMVLIVSLQNKQSAISALKHAGEEVYEIGKLERRDEGTSQCIVEGWDVWTA